MKIKFKFKNPIRKTPEGNCYFPVLLFAYGKESLLIDTICIDLQITWNNKKYFNEYVNDMKP
jgi:hypothetical protein